MSANRQLRQRLTAEVRRRRGTIFYPPMRLCTDNGAMIGCRAYYMALDGRFADLTLNAKPALPITSD